MPHVVRSITQRRRWTIAAGALVPVTLVACQPELSLTTVPVPTEPRVAITASPAQADVQPRTPIVVEAQGGRLQDVAVIGPTGPVEGRLDSAGTRWTSVTDALDYGASYTIESRAYDARGNVATDVTRFSTVEPEKFFTAYAEPADGEVVGVGIPITVNFSKKVDNKAEVERAMVVRTPEPLLGAWAWKDDKTAEFRPKDLWPGDMDVTVELNFEGVQAREGVFGEQNTSQTFRFRQSMVSVVDAATYTMEVFKAGELINTVPITTGKEGWETREGTKVILTKERVRVMDAASGGISADSPDYYRVTAPYAMRLTYSGEFIHAAPWSVASQGSANVSHGCVGLSEENAAWWWNQNDIGDVVIVKNTGRLHGNDGNGLTIWNDTWPQWLERSASGATFTVTNSNSNGRSDGDPAQAQPASSVNP
jgi:lipoprotein-anchoring transpeptidase ErfK/SrfK